MSSANVRRMMSSGVCAAALIALSLPATATAGPARHSARGASAQPLKRLFADPPSSARPRVWWHWMNGNITKDGILKDMEWMKRVGIAGPTAIDANLATPQIVAKRLAFMRPDWKDAFAYAARTADRLDLELGIDSSPGWSESGGPWVPPADAMKKLVWSETLVEGGTRGPIRLAAPPTTSGPFLDLPINDQSGLGAPAHFVPPTFYQDVKVLAVPAPADGLTERPAFSSGDGKPLDAAALTDDSLTTGVTIPPGTRSAPATVRMDFTSPQTVRSMTLFAPGQGPGPLNPGLRPRLEASDDGSNWRQVAEIMPSDVPSTASFPAVTAQHFRLVLAAAPASSSGFSLSLPEGLDMSALGALMKMPQGLKIMELKLSGEPKVDQYELKAGFAVAPDYYALPAVGGGDGVAPAKVIDLTDKMRSDGTLDWTPPPGRWRVIRLGASLTGTTNHPATDEATGLEVDKMDPAAVRRYAEYYIGMYRSAAGAGLIGAHGVRAMTNDSTEVGAFNWTPQMIAQFKTLRGYDPTPWLPTLTGAIIGSRAESDKFLYDFRRTIADLHSSAHYGTMAAVARENHLLLYGEALETGRPSLGDDMAMRSYTTYPMAALWYAPRSDKPAAAFNPDLKGASSVAHVYGQNLAAAESMTSVMVPWATGPSDLRHTIDAEFVEGINRPVIHTSVHQPVDDKIPGLSLSIFGQYFNRHETWAELARPWVDYIARNALLLQQGRNVADVAYFYGEEGPLTTLFASGPPADAPVTSDYDFINTDALVRLLRNDGSELATPSGARYRLLYLGGSSRRLTVPTLRRIEALAEGGATIVGTAPESSPSEADDPKAFADLVHKLWPGTPDARIGRGRVIASHDIEAVLRELGTAPDFRFTGTNAGTSIAFLHRKLAGGDSYFLVNRRFRPETVEAHFRVTGKAPELWHADTGKIEPVSYRISNGETVVPLALGPEESVHVMFLNQAVRPAITLPQPVLGAAEPVAGAWSVRFQPGRGAPASTTLPSLASLSTSNDPGIRYFSGIAAYSKTFQTPRDWKPGKPLWLDLGQVGDLAEVSVNGKLVGTVWHAPFRIDIGGAVRRGSNSLEIRVADLWVNRLIGDAQPGAHKITYTSQPTYTAKAPLRPSGLIGPVTLTASR